MLLLKVCKSQFILKVHAEQFSSSVSFCRCLMFTLLPILNNFQKQLLALFFFVFGVCFFCGLSHLYKKKLHIFIFNFNTNRIKCYHCLTLRQRFAVTNPAGKCMFKVNKNTRRRCEICSKLTIKAPERRLASFWCVYC